VAEIDVERVLGDADAEVFLVTVTEGATQTQHRVTLGTPPPDAATRFQSREAFVEASFRFLLAREPKESILSSFEIREIGRYFAGWEEELPPPS
jgi:hypothetical protein